MPREFDMKYLRMGPMPRTVAAGRVLVHNHVTPQAYIGLNGFRAWTQVLPDSSLTVCKCKWAGVKIPVKVHYRIKASVLRKGRAASIAKAKAKASK